MLVNTQELNPPPSIFSISYGQNENMVDGTLQVTQTDAEQFNNEAMKVSLAGATIFVGSGDTGVNGFDNCDCTAYYPSYPATSPYVVSVGATQNPNDQSLNPPEVVCQVN